MSRLTYADWQEGVPSIRSRPLRRLAMTLLCLVWSPVFLLIAMAVGLKAARGFIAEYWTGVFLPVWRGRP